MELEKRYLHSPICLHGVVLKYPSKKKNYFLYLYTDDGILKCSLRQGAQQNAEFHHYLWYFHCVSKAFHSAQLIKTLRYRLRSPALRSLRTFGGSFSNPATYRLAREKCLKGIGTIVDTTLLFHTDCLYFEWATLQRWYQDLQMFPFFPQITRKTFDYFVTLFTITICNSLINISFNAVQWEL
jgi:hypothetical protein